ncbi:hypothetical protein MAR_003198 [Mya arenaria]|uniref:Uncharacterized protein n=1 Tax=Mya arenaria TaxID=6604 RepID=A0ABY7G5C2_MYAAR|nr:hypothetical protein MAR_003198 [Mya arenaria]
MFACFRRDSVKKRSMGNEASQFIEVVVDTVKETGSTVVDETSNILDKCTSAVEESIVPTLTTAVEAMGSSSTKYEHEQEGFQPDLERSPSYFRSIEHGKSTWIGNNLSSLNRLDSALSEVRVCQKNAEGIGRTLQANFLSWAETCNVKDYIGFTDLHTLVDKIGDEYGDKKREIQQKLRGIQFCKELDVKVFEFTFGEDFCSGQIQFGMIAISTSGIQLEAVSCLYQLDFTLAPVKVTKETKKYFLGLEIGSSTSTWHEGAQLGHVTQRELLNFCRYKALREFQNKHLVTSINSVPSLEYV